MQSNSTFKRLRDALQQGIYRIINPMVHGMIKAGMTPNTVTTIGLLGNIAAAGIFVAAGLMSEGTAIVAGTVIETFNYHWGLVTLAGAVIILFSLFDMLDGQVARLGNMASRYGALYDSTLDRYCELLTLGGIAYYMMMIERPLGALIPFVALVGSVMVSYVRARAEGLGIECKVGFMQRPERVVVTSVGALAAGITGMAGNGQAAIIILEVATGIIAVFANITAFMRLAHCRRELTRADK